MSKKYRVVIVDDEPIAREGVRVQLLKDADAEIVAECANGLEAVAALRDLGPDVVFLDVQMPEMDGFEVLQNVGPANVTAVVFVTAHDQYALKAFDVNAVDYLLKPFDDERFERAFIRAKTQVRRADPLNQNLHRLLDLVRLERNYLERLVVKSSGRIFFLAVSEIDWIEAADNYVAVHAGLESHLIRETLAALEAKLDPSVFIRIRHSAIVNVKRMKELRPLFKGEYEVVLQNGAKLKSSRGYRRRIASLLDE